MVQLAELIELESAFWCLQDRSKCTRTLINFDRCSPSKIFSILKEWHVIGVHAVDKKDKMSIATHDNTGYKKPSSSLLRRTLRWLNPSPQHSNLAIDTSGLKTWKCWEWPQKTYGRCSMVFLWFSYCQIHPIQCSSNYYVHLFSSSRDDVGQGKVKIVDLGVLPELCYELAGLVTFDAATPSMVQYQLDDILEVEVCSIVHFHIYIYNILLYNTYDWLACGGIKNVQCPICSLLSKQMIDV